MTEFTVNGTTDIGEKEIAVLAEKCARLKSAKDAAEKAFKMAKSEFETLCDEHGVKSLETEKVKVTIKHSKRFRAYRDEGAVIKMVPEKYINDVQSLDRKKINGLIEAGILPKEITEEELYTDTTTTTFKAV